MRSATLWLLAGSLAVAGCAKVAPEVEVEPRPVRTFRVSEGSGMTTRTLAGTARAGIESRLSFRVPGTVVAVDARLGDRVRPGEVLARLDPVDYELRGEEAEAGLAAAQAGLRRAEADYDRVRALYENNNASKRELDAARASAESAQAQVSSAEKRLEQARQQLQYTALTAPLAGAIASVDVEVNENVAAGQGVFLLASEGQPEIEVAVPEVLIDRIEVGQRVVATLDAIEGRSFEATVSEVGVAKTGAASTFQVICRLEQTDPAMRAGLAAEVRFEIAPRAGEGRIRVPSVAVGEDREGHFVFVVEKDVERSGELATVHRRPVTPGRFDGEIEILSGLEPGDLVVTAGVRRLADGAVVRVLEEKETG